MQSYLILVIKHQECMDYLRSIKKQPFCSIFFMTKSARHELAKYLSFIFQSILDLYFIKWVKDSFTFARTIKDLNPEATFLCSFDISSLFTNIPLDETINICAETSYNSNLTSPSFFKDTFCQVMLSATKSVEFSFDHIMY